MPSSLSKYSTAWHPKQKEFIKRYDAFLRAALTGHGHLSPFWKFVKMAFFNPCISFKKFWGNILKYFENTNKSLYPKQSLKSSLQPFTHHGYVVMENYLSALCCNHFFANAMQSMTQWFQHQWQYECGPPCSSKLIRLFEYLGELNGTNMCIY